MNSTVNVIGPYEQLVQKYELLIPEIHQFKDNTHTV